jgi:oligopeptide transport system substrate-binding protein
MPRLLPFFLALVLCVPAYAKRETPVEQANRSHTLLLGNGAEPRDLDPQVVNAYTDYNILIALYEGLTVFDEATSLPIPGVAEKWDISDDGLMYTFHLRPDARWSNGDPVTADDFVFSFERILSPELASQYAYMLAPIKGAEAFTAGQIKDFSQVGVRALDARTLQLTLARPTPYLLALAAHQSWFPVHKPTILKFGKAHERGTAWTHPGNLVGNGPYTLAVWEPDQRIVVKKNPLHYSAATNSIESVVFFPIGDPSTEEKNFRTGQLHSTYSVPISRVTPYRNQTPSPLRVEPLLETTFVRFNVTQAPFTDVRVRRALSLAIDREALAKTITQGTKIEAFSFIPPNTAGYTSSARVAKNLAEARRLLTEAGFPGGKGFPRIEVQYSTPIIDPRIVEAVQEMWRRDLGVESVLAPLEFRVQIDNQHLLAFQVSMSRWIGDYNDPATYTDMMTSQSGNNDTGWKNKEYDCLVESSSGERDQTKRYEILKKAEQILIDEAPLAPLFFGTRTYLIRPEVKGWVPNILGVHRYQTLKLVDAAKPE